VCSSCLNPSTQLPKPFIRADASKTVCQRKQCVLILVPILKGAKPFFDPENMMKLHYKQDFWMATLDPS